MLTSEIKTSYHIFSNILRLFVILSIIVAIYNYKYNFYQYWHFKSYLYLYLFKIIFTMLRNKNINIEKTRRTFNDIVFGTSSSTLKRKPTSAQMSRSKWRRTSGSRSPINVEDVEGEGNYFTICIYWNYHLHYNVYF